MPQPRSIKWIVTLAVLTAVLAVVAIWSVISHGILTLRVGLAEEQTAIFEDMEAKAREGEASNAVACLEYALNYYPSGTKQVSGSHLDHIVERARRKSIQNIIASLRDKTRQDYGDDPKRWIEVFKKQRMPVQPAAPSDAPSEGR